MTTKHGLGSQAVFGAFDGMTSVAGVAIGLLALPSASVVSAVIGLAVASSLGMAGGQYESDDRHSIPAALVMGAATCAGTLLPAAGFFLLPHPYAVAWMGVVCVLLTGVIAHRRSTWLRTYGLFLLVAGATFGISLLTPGGAG